MSSTAAPQPEAPLEELPSATKAYAVLPSMRRTIRLVAVAETIGFLAIALALDWLFLDGQRFWTVEPHPFWVIVLAVALRYGTTEALVAVMLCSAALLVGSLPEPSLSEDVFQYGFNLVRRPILWLVAAVVVGEMRNRQIGERDSLRSRVSQAEEQNQALTKSFQTLVKANEDLETRVAGQLRTVISTYEAARALETLEPGQMLDGMSGMVRTLLAPEAFSIHLLEEGGGLRAALTEGWTAADKFPTSYAGHSALYAEVVGKRRFLSAARPDDAQILEGDGLLAGPLRSVETNETLGMVKVERMALPQFHAGTVENFRIVCEWIGTAYANARLYERAKSESVLNPELNLMSETFFDRQARLMVNLGRRVGFDVCTVTVRVGNLRDLTYEDQIEVARTLSASAQTVLRTTDMAFDRRGSEGGFVILLPNTPLAGAEIVVSKLDQDLRPRLALRDERLRLSVAAAELFHHETRP